MAKKHNKYSSSLLGKKMQIITVLIYYFTPTKILMTMMMVTMMTTTEHTKYWQRWEKLETSYIILLEERQNDFLALENKSVKLFQWNCPQTSSFTSGYITKRMKTCLQKKNTWIDVHRGFFIPSPNWKHSKYLLTGELLTKLSLHTKKHYSAVKKGGEVYPETCMNLKSIFMRKVNGKRYMTYDVIYEHLWMENTIVSVEEEKEQSFPGNKDKPVKRILGNLNNYII